MMKVRSFSILVCVLAATRGLAADTQPASPDFKEVFDLVRTHLGGVTESDLNRLAVDSFVASLRPKVALIPNSPDGGTQARPVLSKTVLLDGPIAYLRVARCDADLPQAVSEACQRMSTNKLSGLVLDLRYADGQDYAAAAATVDLFLKQERKLLDWGKGIVSSHAKSDALNVPVAVLVNRETAGAPEALAAVLRETGIGLILGSTTAGQALVCQDYALDNGQHLRIATGHVRIADGPELAAIKPDIAVEVNPAEERASYNDDFKGAPAANLAAAAHVAAAGQPAGTNRLRRPKFNEAELVRERKEGFTGDLESAAPDSSTEDNPPVRDPALARALDVLKGLAIVRASRGS
jgi:hypothetical protein